MSNDLEFDVDVNFLRTLLVPRKRLDPGEIGRLLDLNEEDGKDIINALQGNPLTAVPTYFQARRATITDNFRATLRPMLAVHVSNFVATLNTPLPLPEYVSTNKDGVEEGVVLADSPSGVKLVSENSSNGKQADFNIQKPPLALDACPSGKGLIQYFIQKEIKDLNTMLTEGTYTMTDIGHPSVMRLGPNNATAATIMPENYGVKNRHVRASRGSKPELSAGIDLSHLRKPTKSDEWKSFPDVAVEELIQTSIGHIQSSFFREEGGAQSFRFYAQPPWGLAFFSCGCSAICVFAYEMVGMLLFSIYAGACSVGTDEYSLHIDTLEGSGPSEEVVNLETANLTDCERVGKKTQWTVEKFNEKFYKVIRYDLYHPVCCLEHRIARGENWRRLYKVYQQYSNLEQLPAALVPARLLYGEFQVAIEMDFIDGNCVADDGVFSDQDIADLAQALTFLATNCLAYKDFRPQNVLRMGEGDQIRLIDYDDMKITENVDEACQKYEELLGQARFVSLNPSSFDSFVKSAVQQVLLTLHGQQLS